MLNTTAGNTETTRHVDFTDHSVVNKEGWICGRNGELLIWIPETHRANLHRPSNIWVAGKNKPAWIFLLSSTGGGGLVVLAPR